MSALTLPRNIAERVREEARRLGMSVEEYLVDLLTQGLDPRSRAEEYINAARDLLEQAREELERGDVRQAAEKLWGAAALAVKAYAAWREGRRLASHGELWEYSTVLRRDLGRWAADAWNAGNAMHTCFYEGWCRKEHVEDAIEEVGKLVREVETRIKTGQTQ
ncbi:PaREP1 family protein [Pyrobaculum neutrophilum]|uniref:PaREP1 family protein n=1 Tax=Pyrobaculum neutrophilum (strain DSM 2338 / JCM 9278 / NBRC 100436 / V24Sta) TaxID=444157 RepID=B1YCA6_PYRNV|nr:PaREP1 family protein [Pyrobaculum neutrophilum]ACB39419.1 PaREP1 family protein [Pyrobaculum neutrophilum V24Sta]